MIKQNYYEDISFKRYERLAFVNSLDQLLMKDSKLSYRDAPIVSLHSEMKKDERKKALDDFKNGKVSIINCDRCCCTRIRYFWT